MAQIIDLSARRETWNTSWNLGDLTMSVSNHGRICVQIGGESRIVPLVDAVGMLGRVSESFEKLSGL
jgi:hypothetical protein